MNRRNGMWLTVLCILAAGIFTTSVTSSFVRESTEAAMAVVTGTEARGAQIPVPREASVPEASLKALMDQADAGARGKGEKAPQAAGKIHSDFERGFIRAEVISYEDLIANGSMAAAKEKGLVRSEGKEYVMQDGDVVLFRFNV